MIFLMNQKLIFISTRSSYIEAKDDHGFMYIIVFLEGTVTNLAI